MKTGVKLLLLFGFLTNFSLAQDHTEVYVFLAEKCPICIYMVNDLRSAQKAHPDVTFNAVFPIKNSTIRSAYSFLKKNDLIEFNIQMDQDQRIATEFEATVTPEVVIVKDGQIRYRGRISDAYRAPGKMKHGKRNNILLQNLNLLEKDADIVLSNEKAVGCFITFHH